VVWANAIEENANRQAIAARKHFLGKGILLFFLELETGTTKNRPRRIQQWRRNGGTFRQI
jgi:hypothetical protein